MFATGMETSLRVAPMTATRGDVVLRNEYRTSCLAPATPIVWLRQVSYILVPRVMLGRMSELLLISSSANNMAARDWYPTLDTRSAHFFSVVSLFWWTGTSPPMITSPDSSKGGPRWRKNNSVYLVYLKTVRLWSIFWKFWIWFLDLTWISILMGLWMTTKKIYSCRFCGCIGIFWQNQQNPNEIMMVGHSASQWALFYTSCNLLHPSNWFYLQSWSKVMVHLAFFDNFTIPPPPPLHNVGSVRSKCPPWSNIVWGGGGGGGRAKFGKKSRFYHRTGGDNENKANLGVPYTFDQDCS